MTTVTQSNTCLCTDCTCQPCICAKEAPKCGCQSECNTACKCGCQAE
jgi:hypothetical protein